MTYAEIINYYINHPESYAFKYWTGDNIEHFAIYDKDVDTGRILMIYRFCIILSLIVEYPSKLIVGSANELLVNEFKSLCIVHNLSKYD